MLGRCGSISSTSLASLLNRGHRFVHPLLDRVACPNGVREAGPELRRLLRDLRNFREPPLLGHLMRHFRLSQLRFESAAVGRFLGECRFQFGLAPGEVLRRGLLLGRRSLLCVPERRVSISKLLLEFLRDRRRLCEPRGEVGFALCLMLGRPDSIRGAGLARLLNRGHRAVHPLVDIPERRLGFRQPAFEILAFGALLINRGRMRITEFGLLSEERRMRDQAVESEIDRSERRLGLDDVISRTELERQHCEIFVPVGHDYDRNVELAGCPILQYRKSVHSRMTVLDEQDLKRKWRLWSKVWRKGIELPG